MILCAVCGKEINDKSKTRVTMGLKGKKLDFCCMECFEKSHDNKNVVNAFINMFTNVLNGKDNC